jgi:hypothetical protein
MLGIHFLLLQSVSLLNEFIKELLEQLNNTTRLELVCIGFWGANCQTLLWIRPSSGSCCRKASMSFLASSEIRLARSKASSGSE